MEQLFTDSVAATSSGNTIIQHIQTDYISLILLKTEDDILVVEWQDVTENYQIHVNEVEWLRDAIQKYSRQNGPIYLLIKTYNGIVVDPKLQKVFQKNEMYEGISAVAIELKSTTHRISLNLSEQFNRNRIAIRAFNSQAAAHKWLVRKRAAKY